MITQTVTVKLKESQNIIIGRRGTYDTEQIAFDVSELASTYGNGVAVVMVKRPVDTTAYPVTTTTDGNLVTWAVSETDTSYKGHGELEIFWYVNDGLAKSVIYGIMILRDIGETTETPPDPYETWVDSLTEIAADAQQSAEDAAASAAEITGMAAVAETLPAGSEATANYTDGVLTLGIPRGADGSGGGGTSDYSELTNKPSIEGVTLNGNKTAAQLGLATQSDIPTVPVQSVNGKIGAVVLGASDVGALPADTAIPSKTSDLTNDSGFVNAAGAASVAPVQSVNGQTGAVVLNIPSTAADVGAIAAPASPTSGAFLVWDGSAWTAQTLSVWQGGSY